MVSALNTLRLLGLVSLLFSFGEVSWSQNCLLCNMEIPKFSSPASADPCEDLYRAACLDSDGKVRSSPTARQQIQNVIDHAMDIGAQAHGYDNAVQGVRAELARNGLSFFADLSDEELRVALKKGYFEAEDLTSYSREDMERNLINYARANMASFATSFLDRCKCTGSETAKIRAEAIELYRAEGSDDYSERVEEFVRKLMKREEADQVLVTFINQERLLEAPSRVLSEFISKIARFKGSVEYVISTIYTPERESRVRQMYRSSIESVSDLVRGFVRDPNVRGRILDEYQSNLDLKWFRRPSDSSYVMRNGVPTLAHSVENYAYEEIFNDPTLKPLTGDGAYYSPNYGGDREEIYIEPQQLVDSDFNIFRLLLVVSHEVGHKIGPEISRENRHPINAEYSRLIECYRQSNPSTMSDMHLEECIADFVASEVLAREVSKLPETNRRDALLASMQAVCTGIQGPMHPDFEFRVSGIFGANPSVRRVLSCEGPSTKWKSCGLEVSLLDLPDSSQRALGNSNTQMNRGVQ
jgi:hypothetical protein